MLGIHPAGLVTLVQYYCASCSTYINFRVPHVFTHQGSAGWKWYHRAQQPDRSVLTPLPGHVRIIKLVNFFLLPELLRNLLE